jgi:hypothetical protein
LHLRTPGSDPCRQHIAPHPNAPRPDPHNARQSATVSRVASPAKADGQQIGHRLKIQKPVCICHHLTPAASQQATTPTSTPATVAAAKRLTISSMNRHNTGRFTDNAHGPTLNHNMLSTSLNSRIQFCFRVDVDALDSMF